MTAKFPDDKKIFVLSSPSGGGKTTVAKYLLKKYDNFVFSISATTRKPRPDEHNGKDYHFMSHEEFELAIGKGDLVEYERIYDNYYGTLRSEIDSAIAQGKIVIFDVDVKGALSLKKAYPKQSLLIFIEPPSLDVLEDRLRRRHTESEEELAKRLKRAEMEIAQKDKFDYLIVNNDINETFGKVESILRAEQQKHLI